MSDEVLLWYNEVLGLYFVGNEQTYQTAISRYDNKMVIVLYSMEGDQLTLCEKIRDRLNDARSLAKAS